MRHELKYVLTPGEYAAIRQRLRSVMMCDPHTDDSGHYFIESLYFDNLYDDALLANYAGLSRREKFRIRRYNGSNSSLHLEKKFKQGGVGTKYACPLTVTELQWILAGNTAWMRSDPRRLLNELYVRMQTELLRPKTIIAYRREPYIYPAGNVRITFDTDIRTGVCAKNLLDNSVPLVPTAPGQILMEVKFDAFLPDVIRDSIQEGLPRVGAFSKYASGRQYDI